MASWNVSACLLDLNIVNSPSKHCLNCLVLSGFASLILVALSLNCCYCLCLYLLLFLLLLSTCPYCSITNLSQQLRAKLLSNTNSSSSSNCSYNFILSPQKLPLSVIIDLITLVDCLRSCRLNRPNSSEEYFDQQPTPPTHSRVPAKLFSSTKYKVIQDQACTLSPCYRHTCYSLQPQPLPVRVAAQLTPLFQLIVTYSSKQFSICRRLPNLSTSLYSVIICRRHRERQIYRWLTKTLTAMSCNNSLYKKNGSSSSSSSNISSTGTSGGSSSNDSAPSSGSSSSSHHFGNNNYHHHHNNHNHHHQQQQHYCYNSYFARDNSSANNRKGCDLFNKDDEIRRVYIRPPPNRHACEAHTPSYSSSVKSSSICSLSSSSSPSSSSTPSAFGASPFSGSSSSLSSSSMGPASSSRKWSPFSANNNSKR